MATAQTQSKSSSATDEAERKFLEILRDFSNAMLVTHADGAQLHARPMAVVETNDDGTIWFLAGADSVKTLEASKTPEILAVMQGSTKYLSVAGTAEITRDRAHIDRIWKDSYKVWFAGKDDPNIVLIGLRPSSAEYWDNSGLQGLKFALRYAKAYVKGEQLRDNAVDTKQHGKVQL